MAFKRTSKTASAKARQKVPSRHHDRGRAPALPEHPLSPNRSQERSLAICPISKASARTMKKRSARCGSLSTRPSTKRRPRCTSSASPAPWSPRLGAGRFYTDKVTEAKDATAKLANDYRDEDRDAPVGFDSKAQRIREFAADMAMQAYALLAAAEGAINAYKEITGEDWKAYESQAQGPATVERRSAAAELSAFEG